MVSKQVTLKGTARKQVALQGSGLDVRTNRRASSPSWNTQSTAPVAAATANSNRRFSVKFKPLVTLSSISLFSWVDGVDSQ
jgi:hypothetical protein